MDVLNSDALFNVLKFLPVKDIGTCGRVCKEWLELTREPLLWTALYARDYKGIVDDGENPLQLYLEAGMFCFGYILRPRSELNQG